MIRFLFSILLTTALLPPLLPAADTVFLKNGDSRAGQITQETQDGVTFKFQVRLSNGTMGSTSRQLPWEAIDYILFHPLPGEVAALENPQNADDDQLRELWMGRLKHLDRPRSSAPKLGLIYADRLSAQDSRFTRQRALDIYQRIETQAWDPSAQAEATQGRLQTLIRMGQIKDAIAEARRMAEEAENPVVFLEAKYVLATAEFNRLKEMEEENPRWHLDDEVRPQRNAHFHQALDDYLYAYLFHGSEEGASARGLLGAARVHLFAQDLDQARRCAEDILLLYPETESVNEAKAMLEQISQSQPK